ncbi:MAG: thiamine phosphate synthase [Chloroflexota bacterium]
MTVRTEFGDRSDLPRALNRYLVTDPHADGVEDLVRRVERAIAGGMTAVQLRAKGWTDGDAYRAAVRLRDICSASGVLFLVNDRVDLALACQADGVHLGVDDLPVDVARRLLGPDRVIGYSPETEDDRKQASKAGANYLGVGPVYGTATKDDAGPALGLDRFAAIVADSDLPVIGIGGITATGAKAVVEAGAVGVAVVSDVFLADDPESAAAQLREALT